MTASAMSRAPLKRLRDEVRERVRAGEEDVALALLSAHPDLSQDAKSVAELIADEFALRRELGQAPDPDLWLLTHRLWAPALRRRFAELGVLTEDDGSADPTLAYAPLRPVPEAEDLPPLPPHERREFVKRGGMGVVVKAFDPKMRRLVAMKLMDAGRSATAGERARFLGEARAAARLNHPNILPVLHLGMFEGECAFTMPLCEGGTLADRLGDGPLPEREAAAMMERIARAAEHAHRNGVIHRDLKPSNILFADDPVQPLVADFGLARIGAGGDLTRTGAVMGTMPYMSPEQQGDTRSAGRAADIWSLGVMLHELLAGRRPSGPGGTATRSAVSGTLPPGLRAIVLRCLAPLPEGRFASAGELADALARWQGGEEMPVPMPAMPARQRQAAASLLALAVPLLLGAALLAPSPEPEPTEKEAWRRWAAKELKAGRPVTLIGPTGGPKVHEWRIDADRRPLPVPGPGPLAFRASSPTQLQLVAAVPLERYRFSAELKCLGGNPHSWFGLYALGTERAARGRIEHTCYAFSLRGSGGSLSGIWASPYHYRLATPRDEAFEYRSRLDASPDAALAASLAGLAALPPPPAALAPLLARSARDGWHRLELEIAPGRIDCFLDGSRIKTWRTGQPRLGAE
ncbi:MAG: serine/threonine protein kinase, partial [Gemmataceae bacterium]|nr:serine/threonine protein kinase [Gemmataceae bacterium]